MERAVARGRSARFLDWIERTGNRLPDPAVHFLIALVATWISSAALSGVAFEELDPRTGEAIRVVNQLTGEALAGFLSDIVTTYVNFAPLGVVLVMVLGVGVAEHSGLVGIGLKTALEVTPPKLLTPMLALLSVVGHIIADAAFVALVPLGGALYYAAGRHPLSGLVVSFCGLGGAFAANFLPSGLDPLLQGFTQQAANVIDPDLRVNPLCNWYLMAFSSVFVILATWWVNDRIVEPRLATVNVDADPEDLPEFHPPNARERRALWITAFALLLAVGALLWALHSIDSPLRGASGSLTAHDAPLMRAIVPLMFLFVCLPGVVFGYASGTFSSHKDVIAGMSKAMSSMSYYMVLVFFAALFIKAFSDSNIGALLALKGATFLEAMGLPPFITILGIIFLSAFLNLIIGSASAKWAMLAPILVPMLMSVGIAPELTQMAYRIGDSPTNVVSPLFPYFPLLVAFAVRYVKGSGIGTLISLCLPFAIAYMLVLVSSLAFYWFMGFPLGIGGHYTYP